MSTATDVVTTPSGRTLDGLVPGVWTVDTSHSEVGFTARHLMVSKVRGRFTDYTATITIAPNVLDSTVQAVVQLDSVDTRDEKRDGHLRSADFFDVAKFPQITFQSRSVKRTGEQSADVTGDLTMHGRTRPIVLHVQLLSGASGDRSRWKVTTAPLKRRDFDLVFGGTAEAVSGIGQDVAVRIEIEANRHQ